MQQLRRTSKKRAQRQSPCAEAVVSIAFGTPPSKPIERIRVNSKGYTLKFTPKREG